jgi:hypothetical protein
MITKVVLCRKSTDLSWEGEEPSAVAGEENRSLAVEEAAPLPQAESGVQVTETAPPDVTIIEGA